MNLYAALVRPIANGQQYGFGSGGDPLEILVAANRAGLEGYYEFVPENQRPTNKKLSPRRVLKDQSFDARIKELGELSMSGFMRACYNGGREYVVFTTTGPDAMDLCNKIKSGEKTLEAALSR